MTDHTMAVLAAFLSAAWIYAAAQDRLWSTPPRLAPVLRAPVFQTVGAMFSFLAVYYFGGKDSLTLGIALTTLTWIFAASLFAIAAPALPKTTRVAVVAAKGALVLGLLTGGFYGG